MSQYNILMNRWNGSSYDGLYPKNTLFGNNPPTTSTAGMKGQFYITPPSQMYVCINNENGIYEWKLTNGNKPRIVVNTDGDTVVVESQDGSISYTKAVSGGQAIFPLEDMGITWTVTARNVAGESKSTTVLVDEIKDYPISLTLVDPILDNNTWAKIRAVSDAGTGESYWSVGDGKSLVLNGTVGHLTLNNQTVWAFIVHFRYPVDARNPVPTNTIFFQLARSGKSAMDSQYYAFTDEKYGRTVQSASYPYFSLGVGVVYANVQWTNSPLYLTILGNSASSSSSFPDYSFENVLPYDLRQNMKKASYYTVESTNYGGSNLVLCTDWMWIPSTKEYNNFSWLADSLEAEVNTPYTFYKNGMTLIKNGFGAKTDYSCQYWTRSQLNGNSQQFISYIGSSNQYSQNQATYSYGIPPCFCL